MTKLITSITRLARNFRASHIGQTLIAAAMGVIVVAIIVMVAYAFVGG